VEVVHRNLSAVARLIRVPTVASKATFDPEVLILPSTESFLTLNVASRVDFIPVVLHRHSGGKYSNVIISSFSADLWSSIDAVRRTHVLPHRHVRQVILLGLSWTDLSSSAFTRRQHRHHHHHLLQAVNLVTALSSEVLSEEVLVPPSLLVFSSSSSVAGGSATNNQLIQRLERPHQLL
jgi:hypothetical protein